MTSSSSIPSSSTPHGGIDVVLVGIQGSGKGTQAALLAERYGYTVWETSHWLRHLRDQETPLGRELRDIMDSGNLVPSDIVNRVFDEYCLPLLQGGKGPVVIDAYPRKKGQLDHLIATYDKLGRNFRVVYLTLPEDIAHQRLHLRALKTHRVDDVDPAAISKRIELFHAETEPLIAEFDRLGLVDRIDGHQDLEAVATDIALALGIGALGQK